MLLRCMISNLRIIYVRDLVLDIYVYTVKEGQMYHKAYNNIRYGLWLKTIWIVASSHTYCTAIDISLMVLYMQYIYMQEQIIR